MGILFIYLFYRIEYLSLMSPISISTRLRVIKSAFFWDYSGIGLLRINGIRVLLRAIPFSERTEYNFIHFCSR